MKRMKALLGVVLVIAMVLSLSLTAFAAGGSIKVAEPSKHAYQVWKIFDATSAGGEYVYTTTNDALVLAMQDSSDGFHDLVLTPDDPDSPTTWTVTKGPNYSAEKFATWLAGHENKISAQTSGNGAASFITDDSLATYNMFATEYNSYVSGHESVYYTSDQALAGIPVTEDAYYFVTYSNGVPYALTTVDSTVNNGVVKIQNKADMPFDKDVADQAGNDIHDKSVQAGDILDYTITGKVPDAGDNTQYLYKVWDKLGAGLELTGDVTVTIGGTPVTLARADEQLANPIDNTPKQTRWINTQGEGNYTDNRPTFVVNLDMTQYTPGDVIEITYSAVVKADIGVLVNTAHLVSNDFVKDAQTQNYTSKITVDKFATGDGKQKLADAKFVLTNVPQTFDGTTGARTYAETYYYQDPTSKAVSWLPLYDSDATNENTIAKKLNITATSAEAVYAALATATDANECVIKVTDEDGAADFTGLTDGTYYLDEIAAPTGYVKLETPVEVIVNGAAALDPQNVVDNNPTATQENQEIQLTNVSHIANTPGSVLPSTGGRGTTMLYMAGLGMMLAAGAFLIFRRRAEAGK